MKSRIRILPDHREICTGYQWEKRKKELRERSEGFCEVRLLVDSDTPKIAEFARSHPTHYIGNDGDPHHIVKRSKARDDRLQNLLWICRAAHIEIDNRKVQWSKRVEEA